MPTNAVYLNVLQDAFYLFELHEIRGSDEGHEIRGSDEGLQQMNKNILQYIKINSFRGHLFNSKTIILADHFYF